MKRQNFTREIKIFLASPGDVGEERAHVRAVIEQIGGERAFRDSVNLECIAYDQPGMAVAMEATHTPQNTIERKITKPSECDLVVVILWSRMGTPLPLKYVKPDGSQYLSGTEWEYHDAVTASRKQGRPSVWLYRRNQPLSLPADDPDEEEKLNQWSSVKKFFESLQNKDGSIAGGMNPHATPDEFRGLFEHHLRDWLAEELDDFSGGGEGDSRDPWIVKTLDHVKQAKPLRDLLESPGGPRVAVVEGCTDDRPNYLADDVFLDPWPAVDEIPQEATTLNPARYGEDENAFWSAVYQCLPAPQQAAEHNAEREAVLAWLRERDRHLFYLSLSMVDYGFRLPRLIRAAQGFLADLSSHDPGMRLLLLIACQPRQERSPWWWWLWRHFCRWRLSEVSWLDPLRPLERTDITVWLDGFSHDAKRTWNRDRLCDELLDLFEEGRVNIRYRFVCRHLLDALKRAFKR